MSKETKKLALTKAAPDSVAVEFGMEFKQTFNRKDEPFTVEKKWASMLLRNYAEYFSVVSEKAKPTETLSETPKKDK